MNQPHHFLTKHTHKSSSSEGTVSGLMEKEKKGAREGEGVNLGTQQFCHTQPYFSRLCQIKFFKNTTHSRLKKGAGGQTVTHGIVLRVMSLNIKEFPYEPYLPPYLPVKLHFSKVRSKLRRQQHPPPTKKKKKSLTLKAIHWNNVPTRQSNVKAI